MTSVTFDPVRTDREIDAFCDLPTQLFGSGPVPDMRNNVRAIARGKHPTLQYGHCTLWLGRNPVGEVVARVSTHSDSRIDTKFQHTTQLFGFLAYVDHRMVADQLIEHLATTASYAQRGQLFGSASLLPNQNGGIVTSGWDKPGFLDGPWNPEYVPADLTRHGFVPQFESATYICSVPEPQGLDPETLFPFPRERIIEEHLRIRCATRWRFGRERERLRQLLNASFDQLGYFTPISKAELRHQMEGVIFIAQPDLFLFLERRGEPVAFVLILPDLSAVLRTYDGRLGVRAQLAAVRHARRTKEALLVIKGTVPEVQGQGYMRLLSQYLLRNLLARGYHTLRTTWIEKTNVASASPAFTMGGSEYQEVAFFCRKVDG